MVKVARRYTGVAALAKELGISKGHLSQVLHGRTKSARIYAELEARNIPYKRWSKTHA